MSEEERLDVDGKYNKIAILVPTVDKKYVVAVATITDEDVDTLSDCAITVSDVDGKKEDLKYPFVLLKDIDILRKKLIEDIKSNKDDWLTKGSVDLDTECMDAIIKIISRRFGVE